ncbi:pilus assembly protein PilM [Algisphaera agarilytica]|nr:pilus assembly protein PilM [Algisphaera agarilytica]
MGECGVRLMQLSTRGGQVKVIAAARASLPQEMNAGSEGYHAALAAAIQQAYSEGGFSGNRVVTSLPVSSVQCKNLRLPMMPADELDSAVKWEAQDRFRMGKGQCCVQHMHAGNVNQGDEVRQELILLAAKLDQVESHVAAVTDCGLRPVAIDAVPSALARLSAMRQTLLSAESNGSEVQVILDIGQSATKVLIALDGQVRFYKPIEIGEGTFDSVLSGAMSISLDEARELRRGIAAMAGDSEDPSDSPNAEQSAKVMEALQPTLSELSREVGLCLRYYGVTFRGARPGHADLVGGGATPWLVSALGESAGLSLSLDQPLGGVDLSAVRDVIKPGTEGAWAVAAGLSIRDHMQQFTANPGADQDEESSVFTENATTKEVAA